MRSTVICIVALTMVMSVGCEKAGPGGKKFTGPPFDMENDGPIVVDQGGTASLTVKITRNEGFTAPVTMTLKSFPGGLTLLSGEKEAVADEMTYKFKAHEKAKPVSGAQGTVMIKPEGGRFWSSYFGVTIKKVAAEEPAEEDAEKPTTPAEQEGA